MEAYRAFKKVVPSIGEEKRLGREFEEVSGYSLYRATQAAKQKEEGWFLLKNKLEFAKQIVLEAGDYLRLHLHDDLMISKRLGRQIW